jgi:murein DD-endopeptidase MepM/ murein hydrolase activator NlpD
MRKSVRIVRANLFAKLAAAGLMASMTAACGPGVERFAANPFSDPFKDPDATGSLSQPQYGAPTPQVSSAPLYNSPAVQSSSLKPLPPAGQPSYPVASAPMQPQQPQQHYSAPAQQKWSNVRPDPMQGSAQGWTAQGGAPITVGQGDNLQAIATRYGIPPAAILAANGLKSPAQVTPGSRIVLPVYNAAGAAPQAPARVAQAAPSQPAPATSHTTMRLVQGAQPKGHETKAAEIKKAEPKSIAKVEPKKPEPKQAEVKKVEEPKVAAKAEPQKVASAPVKAEPVAPAKADPVETASVSTQEKAGGDAGFRWPARGRIIAGFGGKGGNEGINIAVPEGTPVKAAEGGVVAYAGSELKGYGNLVLIRHDNGYVSAYANNGEISVKRGEKVRRGQVIAKSGQTGNVSSPQLHFELRKGATPVDPMPHLEGG